MKCKQKYVNIVRSILFFIILPFSIADIVACDKVTKPTTDSTLPNVHWDILHPVTKEHQIISENKYKQDVDGTKIYFTTCKASDPQGLKKMEMSIQANLYCQKLENEAIYGKHYTNYTNKKVDFPPDSENKVPTSGFLSININGNDWKKINCNYGFESVSVSSYILECKAWNWSDKSITRSLTFINK